MCVCVCVCVCVFVSIFSACKPRAPYFVLICGSYDCTKDFPNCLIDGTSFIKMLLKVKFVTSFPLQKLPEIFLLLRRIRPDVIVNVHVSYAKYPLFFWDFNGTGILLPDLRKILKCQIWWESVQRQHSCSTEIERTDMTKPMVAFRNFAKEIKNFATWDDYIWECAKIVLKYA